MYYCPECGLVFDEPMSYREIVTSDPYPMGFNTSVCPSCKSDEFVIAVQCDGCGEYIVGEYVKLHNKECYCEDCYEICDTADI
jgi:hypothetical protein